MLALFMAVGLGSAGVSYLYTLQNIVGPSSGEQYNTAYNAGWAANRSSDTTLIEDGSTGFYESLDESGSIASASNESVPAKATTDERDAVADPDVSGHSKSDVPILIYHSIGDFDGDAEELFVSAEDFAAQLDYLNRTGYTCISFADLWDNWQNKKPLPEKPIILTFDDGYRSFYSRAFPLLLQHKMTATLFLVSEHYDLPRGMTRGMIRDVAAEGFEIGSHSRYHRNLAQISLYEARQEVLYSKEDLEKLVEKPVKVFAYPEGEHNADLRSIISEAGYRFAVTTEQGLAHSADDYFQLKRIIIGRSDGLQGLVYKLESIR